MPTTFDVILCPCSACTEGGTGEARGRSGPTPWALLCSVHGRVFFSHHEYKAELRKVGDWTCHWCEEDGVSHRHTVEWDQDNEIDFEQWSEMEANDEARKALIEAARRE